MDDRYLIIIAGAVGALVGTFITAVTNLILASINHSSEERRQFYELTVKAGIDQFNQDLDSAHKQTQGRNLTIVVPPLQTYIVHNFLLLSALGGRRYKVKELEKRLAALDDDYSKLVKAFKIRNPDGTIYEPKTSSPPP
jgi:gas vesicle protein